MDKPTLEQLIALLTEGAAEFTMDYIPLADAPGMEWEVAWRGRDRWESNTTGSNLYEMLYVMVQAREQARASVARRVNP